MGFISDRVSRVTNFGKKIIGTEQIVENFKYGKESAEFLLNSAKQQSRIKKSKTTYTFDEIMKQNGFGEAQIPEFYKNYSTMFYLFFVPFIFCLISMGWSFTHTKILDIVAQFLPSLSIGLFFLVKSFQYGVMAYQIRYREMIGIKEYLKRGLNIFPTFKL